MAITCHDPPLQRHSTPTQRVQSTPVEDVRNIGRSGGSRDRKPLYERRQPRPQQVRHEYAVHGQELRGRAFRPSYNKLLQERRQPRRCRINNRIRHPWPGAPRSGLPALLQQASAGVAAAATVPDQQSNTPSMARSSVVGPSGPPTTASAGAIVVANERFS
ncbi:MAG: hypothetical protein OJF55_001906 [Rhodanobacteraceae bacterium]|nr:MAG: hypothetical protein OJF55_001906 [Rhodanobacteraceae bacterium]